MKKPHLAIIMENTLALLGLKSLLGNIIPFAEIHTFSSLEDAQQDNKVSFFHYFVSSTQLNLHLDFFTTVIKQTFVCDKAEEKAQISKNFHFISSDQSQHELIKSLMILQQDGHHNFEHYPQEIASKLKKESLEKAVTLTPRELEILKIVAKGKSSKEIANTLHISLYTVITHRKNIMEKLHAHSATKVIVYAVNHGLISPAEI